jgi:hypothetical protein
MATKDEIEVAVKLIKEIAGDPSVGVVKELIDAIQNSAIPAKEVRVKAVEETR